MSVLLFKIRKYQIMFKFLAKFCCTATLYQKLILYVLLFPCLQNHLMENPIDLIALIILVTFLKLSPPFATCNSQLHYLPLFYFSPISL